MNANSIGADVDDIRESLKDAKITTRASGYARSYVYVGSTLVALMERSPFTGEWCYGARMEDGTYGQIMFRPPFKQTSFKTARSAAKVAVREIGEQS